MEKFLIINPFGIGDVLFTTPVIKAIKEKHPGSYIGYWCNERVGELLKGNPDISKVFPLSRGDIKRIYKGLKGINKGLKGLGALSGLIMGIRRERFDAAFDFSLDTRYGLWSKLAGIKKRIGFDYKARGRFLTDRIVLTGYSGKHVVEYYADLLKLIEVYPKDKSLYLNVSDENKANARRRLSQSGVDLSRPVIGIAMGGGASWGKDAFYKQWPAENFGQLAQKISREAGAHIVLLGSSDEKLLAGKIIDIAGNKNIADLTGKFDLEELAAAIKELSILVCNDGGPLHMAVALGVSTVSIFGPVDEKVYGPYPPGQKHAVIKKDVSCRPCYKDFRFNGCDNDRRCLEDVSVDEVFQKVKDMLCAAT
ncbi:MAG: glycosyltransferase family 9 protein [Candidatus Omnitrophota bacterium]|nr:glycosyltransferase family 9 protein [Candidatus Omnitrophota bacterium]